MKKSFFEKSYITTLLLFLVLLNGGFIAVAAYTYSNTTKAAKTVCRTEQFYVAEAFAQDRETLNGGDDYLLQVSYGSFYGAKHVNLAFEEDGEITYSDIPPSYKLPEVGELSISRIDGKRILMIREEICDGELILTYSKDISYLDSELYQLLAVFAALSLFMSVLLAVLLYFIQRKLYLPLKNLQSVTREISCGDFSSRADDTGDDEFSALARDFNSMTDTINNQINELKVSASQKQQMLDNLAHEMRTPLTSIYGYAEYAFGVELSEEERLKAMSAIMSETIRLRNISTVLLDSAFIRENGITPVKLSAAALTQKCFERFQLVAQKRGIALSCKTADFEIMGDETLLEELLSNLADNALKACGDGGIIELGCYCGNDGKGIYVKDNGIGMTEEQLAHITEPFYRTDKARSRKNGGTGLGLSLCKRIAQSHGATLCFKSTPSVGTVAYIEWKGEGDGI